MRRKFSISDTPTFDINEVLSIPELNLTEEQLTVLKNIQLKQQEEQQELNDRYEQEELDRKTGNLLTILDRVSNHPIYHDLLALRNKPLTVQDWAKIILPGVIAKYPKMLKEDICKTTHAIALTMVEVMGGNV